VRADIHCQDSNRGDDEQREAAGELIIGEPLQAGNVKEAEPPFRAVADETVARISQDKKDAAAAYAAYRNLGAISGLAEPKRAREAYADGL
jgi:hypothetical protein